MGTGQMLITIGAIMLLGTIILTTNRGINNSSQVMLQTNFGLESVSLCASTIDEAEALNFDENTREGVVASVNQLTPPANLGQESTVGDTLDDFDDYDGPPNGSFRQVIDSLGSGAYVVRTTVRYVNFGTLSINTTSPTWLKKLDVWAWNTVDSANSVVHMSAVYGYWYFR